MATRPTRRVAARRNVVVDDSDDDLAGDANKTITRNNDEDEDEDEDDFTPAPAARSPRRSTVGTTARRRTTAAAAAAAEQKPPPATRTRRTRASAAAAPLSASILEDPDQTAASVATVNDENAPAGKKPTAPRKRKSVAPRVKSEASAAADANATLTLSVRGSSRRTSQSVAFEAEAREASASASSTSPSTQGSIPTPQPSASPEPGPVPAGDDDDDDDAPAALTDITAVANEQQRPRTVDSDVTMTDRPRTANSETTNPDTIKPIRTTDTVLEKPMDILLKSRTLAAVPAPEPTGPKPRTVITYLVLTNFKSYAGRQEIGPFHASFSSVVGPNGSGKSNVIDALLFVFGFRASKMRQGKLSALIHNSAEFPDLDYCEVAVHFREVLDRPGGVGGVAGEPDVLPNSDLVVSRKAFRTNASTYAIDGKASNFTTVTTLLRERGVDLDHKRFLILQGEVESIAQMKPKAGNEHEDGLLEYLEDIIGTSKYKTPIEEAAAEVETLNDTCMEKSGRVQHVEKEKHSLEDKKERALAYVRDENALATKQAALYQLYLGECDDNVAVAEEALAQMQAELDVELEKHAGGEQEIRQLEKAFAKGERRHAAQAAATGQLAAELAHFDQERVKVEAKRKFLHDKRKKLEAAQAAAAAAADEAAATTAACTEELATRADAMAALEAQIAEEEAGLVAIRDGLKGKTQAFSDQIAAKQKALAPWQAKIAQKASARAVAASELAILRERATAGATALAEMEAKLAGIEQGRAATAAALAAHEAEQQTLVAEAAAVAEELGQLAAEEPRLRAQVSHARQRADEARSRLAATQTQGNVLAALLRLRESGRVEGFHGRLGQLGTIDARYDVAISTACPALDHFVTDTVEAGQQCIEYLRKTNLGRGHFVCLDRLRVGRGGDGDGDGRMGAVATPEDAPRLFDLVTATAPRFRAAFYHALQDTLVATDLAQAKRLAYGAKRWRVVTLAGELIDKSGTLSGGGSVVRRGLMSGRVGDGGGSATTTTTKEQVGGLEGDRDALEQQLEALLGRQRALETRQQALQTTVLPAADTQQQKLRLELASAATQRADAQRRLQELRGAAASSSAEGDGGDGGDGGDASDSTRAAALESEMATLQADIERLHGETASVEAEIRALQDKIMEVGGERLRAQRAAVDASKAALAAHAEATSAAEVRRAKAEKQQAKAARDGARAGTAAAAAADELAALDAAAADEGARADELAAAVEAARAELALQQTVLAEVEAERDAKRAALNASRAAEIEVRNKLEEHQKALTENQRRRRYWADKLGKLRLKDEATGEEGPAADDDETGGLPQYTRDELADLDKETLKTEIAALEEATQKAQVDVGVLAEYRRRVEEHAARSTDLAAAVAARDGAKARADELRRRRLEGFLEGFSLISLRLKEMYQMITMGGNAELELVDSLDPFAEGILFSVMPPKKSWKNISNLSGGEKTLSSLALVFALHHYKPTPLYVMDEIDAALDFRNVSIVANYIKERTKNAQFIVISLRNNMFELAARLVGVYKVNHRTKSVTLENRDYIVRRRPNGSGSGSGNGNGNGSGGGGPAQTPVRNNTTVQLMSPP